jgi:hypothetical protein
MAKILEFKKPEKPENAQEPPKNELEELMKDVPEEHAFGKMFCVDCKHEWDAVVPIGTDYCECPECHRFMGRHKYSFMLQKSAIWQCACENSLFEVTMEGIFCPSCGRYQEFPY